MLANGLESQEEAENYQELLIIKIELPAVIIGREYKEGSYMKIKFVNPFRKHKEKKGETAEIKPLQNYYDRTEIDKTNAAYRLIIG